jgi:hypothetical protein
VEETPGGAVWSVVDQSGVAVKGGVEDCFAQTPLESSDLHARVALSTVASDVPRKAPLIRT